MLPFSAAQRAIRFDSSKSGLISSRLVLEGPGTLIGVQGFNNATEVRYVMFFDATADAGQTPVAVIKAAPGANFYMELPIVGMPFQRGIAMAISTTPTTLTLSSTIEVLIWGSIVGDVA